MLEAYHASAVRIDGKSLDNSSVPASDMGSEPPQSEINLSIDMANVAMHNNTPSLNPPPDPFPTDRRQAFNWLTTTFTMFWNMASKKPTIFENLRWKEDIIKEYGDKKKIFKSTNPEQLFAQAVATLLVQDTDVISVAECPWSDHSEREPISPRRYFVTTNGHHNYSMEPVQEDHVGKRLKELQDLIEETKGNPELHPKMTLSSTKYAVSKIIRRCNVGPKWKLTITMKAAAADPTGEIFDSCSKATTVAESDIGHERRWLKNSYLLIKPYIAQFPDKLAFMQLIAQADGPTIYTGRRRQLICQTVWALISLYYSLANALALHLGKQLPSYRIKSKFMFDKFKVGSDGSNTRPSDDELIAGLTNVGSVLHKLVGLNMFQKLAQDLGSIYKNAERLKESPPTQSDIHLRESVQPPDHINKGTMETSNNADVGGAAQLDVETETGDDDNDDNDVPDVAVPDPESVEEQEAEAEGLPPSSTTLASKFTWRFTAWVRLLVTHLIACQRVQHYIKDKETCLTFTLLDMPYEKMSTGPSMENVLSAMSIGEFAIAKLKDHQREHNNIPKTQSKETTSLLSQFHGVIHSEMALAMSFFNYLRSYPPQTFPKRQFDIGTSKPCCPVCYVFLHIIASVYQIPICIGNYHLTPSPVSLPPNVTDEIGKEIFARIYNTVLKMAQSLQLPPDAVKTYRHSDSGSSTKTDTSVMSDHPEEESDSDDSDDIPFDQFREALRQRS